MGRVTAAATVPLAPADAQRLWLDRTRWPAFVDGFSHVVRCDPEWPDAGALTWQSAPQGRGRVIERAVERGPRRLVLAIEDERLAGTQIVAFDAEPDGGTLVAAELDYRLKERTALTPVLDRFFVRRALRDALGRTVRRYAREAISDVELGGSPGSPRAG